MDRIPLIGGSYVARSIIANAQRCVNLFPESNTRDAMAPVTHYQRPGYLPLVQGPMAPVRCLYRASNGNGYAVIGSNVYYVTPNFVLTLLGQITAGLTGPCKMADNGNQILLVDGSAMGWTITLANNAFAVANDTSGLFAGANWVDVIDGFTLWNFPGTRNSRLTRRILPRRMTIRICSRR
jgi:hypothetical protein